MGPKRKTGEKAREQWALSNEKGILRDKTDHGMVKRNKERG